MIRLRAMRVATSVALTCALSACATARVPSARDPFHDVNLALRGERAIVELSGGEVAPGVSHVHLSLNEASWVEAHRTRTVPTADVDRVIVVSRPSHAPAGLLLLLGLGLSVVFDRELPFDFAFEVALDSFVWGSEVSPAFGRVVYSRAGGAR